MPANINCLMTTVVNTSGEVRRFGFLPPRGRTLAVDAEFSAIGTIVDWVQSRGGHRPIPEKLEKSIRLALESGDMEIKKTPAVVLYDATAENSKIVALDDATLETATPCWLEA